jgi:hypothetical protein
MKSSAYRMRLTLCLLLSLWILPVLLDQYRSYIARSIPSRDILARIGKVTPFKQKVTLGI